MENIKSFDQYLSERFNEEEMPMPDDFFEVVGDSRPTQLLVSLTKTVTTDSPETKGWDVMSELQKEMMSAIEGIDGFRFAGDGFNRNEDENGAFTIVANVKLLYFLPEDGDPVDMDAVFRGLSGDTEVEVSEVE
jgi:hypothetical protein